MTTPTATTGRSDYSLPGSSIPEGIRTVATRIAGYIREQRRDRAAYTALRGLDDHMLRDIGLSRADIVDLETFGRGW